MAYDKMLMRRILSVQFVPLPPTEMECPRKPNLLLVGLLMCRVFHFSGGKTRQIWVSQKIRFHVFCVPATSNLSARLSSFFFCFSGNKGTYVGIICGVILFGG